jgi:hydrophobic/amphiphilic exporter-1 (mainly G- bacteria), HAE1 family
MLKMFIYRPVLSTVISIIVVVLGIIGINKLSIEQYPDIAPPTVRVSTTFSGANADVVLKSVIVPLEEQINGVEGMTYMSSTASNGGSAEISVYFEQGTDPDMAAVNVQNRVSKASSLLPSEVTQNGVTVQKQQTGNVLLVMLKSSNPAYDDKFLANYLNINLVPQLKRVKGVGSAGSFSTLDYAMRVWLLPDAMAANKLTPSDVVSALKDQNIDIAPGEVGERGGQTFQYALRYTGRLKNAEEFGNIVLKSDGSKQLLLKDVARVEMGAQDYSMRVRGNGQPAALVGISQTAGSNARQIIKDVKAEVEKASKSFPPGVTYEYQMDASRFLNASIEKVLKTLFEAFLLVFLVVFVFLQDWRATLIPATAVPVAIIGTFFFLMIMGFSINLLTLFALVLAIGIVVDDAIVVTEAVHSKIEGGETNPQAAAVSAMGEITPAIVSITLVMASVFVPVSFIGGTSGVFFKQFGLTLAVAIFLSMVNALTLAPALCAIFLRPKRADAQNLSLWGKFCFWFNTLFRATTDKYRGLLAFLSKKRWRWIALVVVVLFSFLLFGLTKVLPTGFVPQEDSGTVMGGVTLAPGTSLDATDSLNKKLVAIASKIPHVKGVTSMAGYSFTAGSGSCNAALVVDLDPWDKRNVTADEVAGLLKKATDTISNASFMFFGVPTIMGLGMSNGVELKMQDRTGGDINTFYQVVGDFLKELRKRPEVMMAMTTFNPNFPQKLVEIDVDRTKRAGLGVSDVLGVLQTYVGGSYVSNFNSFGKQYRVVVQASPERRARLDDLQGLMVKTSSGEMAPITEFLSTKDVTGPQSLTRFNLYSSMDVTIIPNYIKGYTSSDVNKLVGQIPLPTGYGYAFSGMSREEVANSNQIAVIFILCAVFVYLLLAALYESYILPLAVMLSFPIGLSGVLLFVFFSMLGGSGIVDNIYVQISLVMLIGLLAKNGILIVEYALQRRRKGMDLVQSAIEGATARLRPILMTSFAFIFGLLPLALANGAGAVGNRSIGISAVGGMLVGTVFGVVVIPVLFVILQGLQERLRGGGPAANETKVTQ